MTWAPFRGAAVVVGEPGLASAPLAVIVAGAQAPRGRVHENIAYRMQCPDFEPDRIDRQPRSMPTHSKMLSDHSVRLEGRFDEGWKILALVATAVAPAVSREAADQTRRRDEVVERVVIRGGSRPMARS